MVRPSDLSWSQLSDSELFSFTVFSLSVGQTSSMALKVPRERAKRQEVEAASFLRSAVCHFHGTLVIMQSLSLPRFKRGGPHLVTEDICKAPKETVIELTSQNSLSRNNMETNKDPDQSPYPVPGRIPALITFRSFSLCSV